MNTYEVLVHHESIDLKTGKLYIAVTAIKVEADNRAEALLAAQSDPRFYGTNVKSYKVQQIG